MGFLDGIRALFSSSTPTEPYTDTSKFVIIDVRTPAEYEQAHVQGALNIDFLKSDFKERVQKLDKTKTYKVYCRSGNRSGQALYVMKGLGFSDVENLGSLSRAAKRLNRVYEGGV